MEKNSAHIFQSKSITEVNYSFKKSLMYRNQRRVKIQAQSFGAPAASLTMNQTPAASGSASGAQPKQQKVRARRGQATDPHSIAERVRTRSTRLISVAVIFI